MVRDDWVQSDGKWYYMNHDGVMQVNRLIDDTYFVDGNGVMVTNAWMYSNDGWSNENVWRYFGSNGKAYTNGWKQIDNVWYHFSDSIMDSGWLELDGDTYYLGSVSYTHLAVYKRQAGGCGGV